MNKNKILIFLSIIIFFIGLCFFVGGIYKSISEENAAKQRRENIVRCTDELVSACDEAYEKIGMSEEEKAELDDYKENMAKESDPVLRAYIAIGMSRYVAEEIVNSNYYKHENTGERLEPHHEVAGKTVSEAVSRLENALE